METGFVNWIIATVALDRDKVGSGGSPVFFVDSEEELLKVAMLISRLTDGIAHDLGNGVFVIIRH